MWKNKIYSMIRFAALAGSVSLSNFATATTEEHSPRLWGAIDYEIGGGLITDAPTRVHTINILDFGIEWEMECGILDADITIGNQLNGITDGFNNMMDDIITAATGAVAALPALALQRANPGLYDLLQQGILQGKMDFEWAETSCDEMAGVMWGDDSFPFEKYKLGIKTNNWAEELDASGGDAVEAKNQVDDRNHGDEGSDWICGDKAGGAGQPPIETLSDITLVGYNIMFDRADVCDDSPVDAADGEGTPLWSYWTGPLDASAWATRVIGESEIRTCTGCDKMVGEPGKGLTYMHRELYETIEERLTELVDGDLDLTWENLSTVSAPPGAVIHAPVIYAIRKRPAAGQTQMIQKLAGEIAYTRLIEQARLLTQIMRTGVKEPNVSSFEPAKIFVNETIDQIQVEMDQLDREIQQRKLVAKGTIQKILGFEEKRVQNTRDTKRIKSSGTTSVGQP